MSAFIQQAYDRFDEFSPCHASDILVSYRKKVKWSGIFKFRTLLNMTGFHSFKGLAT